jgi:hypothetical protein
MNMMEAQSLQGGMGATTRYNAEEVESLDVDFGATNAK